jgi:hypothetical protein
MAPHVGASIGCCRPQSRSGAGAAEGSRSRIDGPHWETYRGKKGIESGIANSKYRRADPIKREK